MNDTHEDAKLTMANTKKDMLQAYQRLLKRLQAQEKDEMKPEKAAAQRKLAGAVAVADATSSTGIARQIASLKTEIGRTLNELADQLEQETAKYAQVKVAVAAAEADLREIYDIEKAASSLAALLEAQREQRAQFETKMTADREQLESEIATYREAFDNEVKLQRELWKKEKTEYATSIKERDADDEKRRNRSKEEWQYQFEREKQLAMEQRQHELAAIDREIELKKEQLDKVLAEREQAVASSEAELQTLRAQADGFPAQLEQAVAQAVQQTTARLERERTFAIDLSQKESAGETNVLKARIESLTQTVEKQAEQIAKLSKQLEHSYGQVQDIALKAIDGSSRSRSINQVTSSPAPMMGHGAGSSGAD